MLLNADILYNAVSLCIHFKATVYLFKKLISIFSESEEKAMEWDKVLKKSAISRPGDHRSHSTSVQLREIIFSPFEPTVYEV
jgi:hypothetical protein